MLSIAPAAKSTKYYGADNYYFNDGRASTRWFGKGAEALGLKGEVEKAEYEALYKGHLPGGIKLGRMKDGDWKHYSGWDLTFAAPKSVSIMAEVFGERRLIDAHDRAVDKALSWIEANYAVTRIRRDNKIHHVPTGNFTTAVYRHDVSRAGQPHLHSHAVVMNATQDQEGKWRSVDGRFLWQEAVIMGAGLIYRQELARDAVELGHSVIPRSDGTFDIDGVPKEVIDYYSTRSREMERYLAAQGLNRDSATAEQRNIAMQRTRPDKPLEIEPEQQRERWREEIAGMGYSLDKQGRSVERAEERAAEPGYVDAILRKGYASARQAVDDAAKSLVESDAIFADQTLHEKATVFSLGRASYDDLRNAVTEQAKVGDLIFREAKVYEPVTQQFEPTTGWTTPAAKRTETDMLAIEQRGRDSAHPAYDRAGARQRIEAAGNASREAGHDWNDGQRNAAEGLLTSPHKVTALQGYAGSAKTTTVLTSYAGAMKGQGHEITAMAPTNTAANVLGLALSQEGRTVASHLIKERQDSVRREAPQVWLVDEASMLSAKETHDLLRAAERADARMVMVGDVMQLASVDAGRAFSQLQDNGMKTFVLDQIVRQQNPTLRQAVEHGAKGDASTMLDLIERGGGQIIQVGQQVLGSDLSAEWIDRITRMADDYMALSPEERARTLLIDPSREGRDVLNKKVRWCMEDRGELQNIGIDGVAHILVSKDLTSIEKAKAFFYEPGDVVRFQRRYGAKSKSVIHKDEELDVEAVDPKAGLVTLRNKRGQDVPWRPAQWSKVEAYEIKPRELALGETITFTRSDKDLGVRNGEVANVLTFDPEAKMASLQPQGSEPMTVSLKAHRHWDYGYAQTVHLSQAKTADRALIHAESYRANVVHMRSAYVAVSRGRLDVRLYTDNPKKLQQALTDRSGAKAAAMDLSAIKAGQATVVAAQRPITPTRAPSIAPQPTIAPPVPSMGR